MRKRVGIILLGVIASMLGCAPVQGASRFRDEASERCHFMWGIKAGFDLITADKPFALPDITFERGGLGINAGLTARLQWRDRWYVQPSLTVAYDTQSVRLKSLGPDDQEPYEAMRRGSVMIPIHLGWRFTVVGSSRMSLFTGGWVSYSFAGSFTTEDSATPGRYSLHGTPLYGDGGIWSRISAGPAIGATLESTSFPLSVTIDGYMGVTQMARKDIFYSNYMTESVARLTFVYWFRL